MSVLKRALLCIAIALVGLEIYCSPMAISLGHSALSFDPYSRSSLNVLTGMTMNFSPRFELCVHSSIEVTPKAFGDIALGAEISYNLTGESVRQDVAGDNISVLASAGILCNNHNPEGLFLPTSLTLRIFPAVVGSPASKRRERLIPFGICYNFYTNQLSLYWSAIIYDHYIN